MAGRKPLLLGHVDGLDGSERAKCRLRSFMETLCGTNSVSQACRDLELHESQFHELRREWLQSAVALLEPRRVGRPPRSTAAPLAAAEHERLTSENADLRRQLQTLQQRVEIERILAAPTAAPKKTVKPR